MILYSSNNINILIYRSDTSIQRERLSSRGLEQWPLTVTYREKMLPNRFYNIYIKMMTKSVMILRFKINKNGSLLKTKNLSCMM